MSSGAWVVVGVIFSIAFGIVGIFYAQRSSARAAQDAQQQRIAAAVRDATEPLEKLLDRRDRAIEVRDRRIEQLEDQLRQKGG